MAVSSDTLPERAPARPADSYVPSWSGFLSVSRELIAIWEIVGASAATSLTTRRNSSMRLSSERRGSMRVCSDVSFSFMGSSKGVRGQAVRSARESGSRRATALRSCRCREDDS